MRYIVTILMVLCLAVPCFAGDYSVVTGDNEVDDRSKVEIGYVTMFFYFISKSQHPWIIRWAGRGTSRHCRNFKL